MAAFEANKLTENTIVVFMSDNGHSRENYSIRVDNHLSGLPRGTNYGANGSGGNTGKWRGTKRTFYEGVIRIPAIISYPAKLPRGAVRDQAITAMDWLPTVLELCCIKKHPAKLDGKSLVPVLRSESAPSPHKVMHWHWQWQDNWLVREGERKLIGKGKQPTFSETSQMRSQKKNYLKEKPELVKHLQSLHAKWTKEVKSSR